VTLVRPEFAQLPHLKGTLGVTCIHGETRQYPTTMLTLKTTKGSYSGPARVVPDLPVSVLIGRNFPLFRQLWFRETPEDPPCRHFPGSAARRPASVGFRTSTPKPPPTPSPKESPAPRRQWLKRKLGM